MKLNENVTWRPKPVAAGALKGKQVAVIGGTGGLGRALSRALAAAGARVIVVGQTFRDSDSVNIHFIPADLSLMKEAQRVAALLPAENLDMLVFTTGIFAAPQRQETAEGIERDLAVSYLNRLLILQQLAPRLGTLRKQASLKPRVFLMGYPGSGQKGEHTDLNAEQSYSAMAAHMNTVAGNEMLVLDGARRYPHLTFFGLNPGLIKTGIRNNFLGQGSLKSRITETLIGLLTPTPEQYAQKMLPLLLSPDLERYSGSFFNRKAQAILPSPGLDAQHIRQFIAAAEHLLARTGVYVTAQSASPLSSNTLHSMTKDFHMKQIFTSTTVGRYTLKNRFAMAPMTRSRAEFDGTPGKLAAEYYAQRAEVGLIIAEGTQPSDDGQGYLMTPGIYADAHVAGWKQVSDAVHAKGSRLFIQLMHAGRMSHPDNTPHHRQGVAPSAIAPGAKMFTPTGMQDAPVPHALSTVEVQQTIQDFRVAARRAIEAGADGVEIHGANAYLIHQFLAPSANTRSDEYGGSIENRARFAIEVAAAIAEEIGADRTAIRLSPGMNMWGIEEGENGAALYRYLVAELNKLGLAYLHLMHLGNEDLLQDIRILWKQSLILNRPGKPREQIGNDVAAGLADLESYGQMILANPDFMTRLEANAPFNEADRNTYFGGTEKGFTDYPALNATR